jgi:hypothetical protein
MSQRAPTPFSRVARDLDVGDDTSPLCPGCRQLEGIRRVLLAFPEICYFACDMCGFVWEHRDGQVSPDAGAGPL